MSGTITAQTMLEQGKLLELDEVRRRLQATEPLTQLPLVADRTAFAVDPQWYVGLERKRDDDPVDCMVQADGLAYRFTKESFLETCAHVGLPRSYVTKTPGDLIAPHLTYWYTGAGKAAKLLTMGEGEGRRVLGLAGSNFQPISNLALLDRALERIHARYDNGHSADVYVDRKMHHDVRSTSVLMVVPEASRAIRADDNWSGGVSLRNSLTGEEATQVHSYLFRWWCTNGAINTKQNSATYSRRAASPESPEDFIGRSVDAALAHLEPSFDRLAELAETPVEGEVNDLLNQIFDEYRMPQVQREAVRREMLESADLTVYGVMQAVTAAANRAGLSAGVRRSLMEVGADVMVTGGRCAHCGHAGIHVDHG